VWLPIKNLGGGLRKPVHTKKAASMFETAPFEEYLPGLEGKIRRNFLLCSFGFFGLLFWSRSRSGFIRVSTEKTRNQA